MIGEELQISVVAETFPLAEVFTISRGSRTQAHVLTVTVSDGQYLGRGECVPYARYNETLEGVSAEILAIDGLRDRAALAEALPAGAARNALDCALWDLEAKRAGKPVWKMAGLAKPGPEVTAFTLSLAEPDQMEAAARRHAFRPMLKIKLGTPDDMPRLEAVRRGAPNSRIIVDANEGWSAEVYADLAQHLVNLGVTLVEQPLPAGQDEALIGMDRPVPVCADESCHDRESMTALFGKYDVVNIKLDKTGGLTEALALRETALKSGFQVMVGCMVGSSLAMAPAVLVAQGAMVTDLDGPLLLAQDRENALKFDELGVHPPDPALWG